MSRDICQGLQSFVIALSTCRCRIDRHGLIIGIPKSFGDRPVLMYKWEGCKKDGIDKMFHSMCDFCAIFTFFGKS